MKYYVEAIIKPTTISETIAIKEANVRVKALVDAINVINSKENANAVRLLNEEIIKVYARLKEIFKVGDKTILITESGVIHIFDKPSGGVFEVKLDEEKNVYIEDDKPEVAKKPEYSIEISSESDNYISGYVKNSLTNGVEFTFTSTENNMLAIFDLIKRANGEVV